MWLVELSDYKPFEGEALKVRIRSLSRAELDEQIQWFGSQYAHLCQRLEALYMPDRQQLFWAIRPGGLDEIDKALAEVQPDNAKERALLQSFRELNRVLSPFMDIYEEHVIQDVKHLSKDELETLYVGMNEQLTSAQAAQTQDSDPRKLQNASGTIRLATLLKDAIRHELKERFGAEPGI